MSKTLSQHKELENNFTQYLFTNAALQRIINGKLQHKEGNYYTLEKAENNLLTNQKEDNHKKTPIIPPLTTKITGSNNLFSLISLNINESKDID